MPTNAFIMNHRSPTLSLFRILVINCLKYWKYFKIFKNRIPQVLMLWLGVFYRLENRSKYSFCCLIKLDNRSTWFLYFLINNINTIFLYILISIWSNWNLRKGRTFLQLNSRFLFSATPPVRRKTLHRSRQTPPKNPTGKLALTKSFFETTFFFSSYWVWNSANG